jgi:hypothetical protein
MGDDNTDTAAARLRHLTQYFREHPVTGPAAGHATTVAPAAPLSLATLDHIRACVTEVIDHTLAANPDAAPVPAHVEAVYDWCREQTRHADETVRLRRDIIEYRQYLEHAIRAGDVKVVRPLRCPECHTWGLMWVPERQLAVCTNTDCVDHDGISNAFPLGRLATHHMANRKNPRDACAT